MSADIFMKIKDIAGESKDKDHHGEIELHSWSWGEANVGSAAHGGGMGVGKVDMQDIQISKSLDKASPKLLLQCANGKHIPEAILVMRKATGTGGQKTYLKIVLNDLVISSYSITGAGTDTPMESISLNFGKINVEYFEQDNKGTMTSTGAVGWDQKQNVAVA